MAPTPPDLTHLILPALAADRREALREMYRSGLADGSLKPFLLPQALLGTFVLPILYLSVPHARRPWLRRARFAVFALIVAVNTHLMRTASSTNIAFSYAVGLSAAWGIMWSAALLLWMRPQEDLARVDARAWSGTGARSRASSLAAQDGAPVVLHHSGNGNGSAPGSPGPSCIIVSGGPNGGGAGGLHSRKRSDGTVRRRKSVRFTVAPDEDVAAKMGEFEYYWQGYPADEPFLTRLGWCTDLVCAFRGCGWNWSIPSVPNFTRPDNPHASEPVNIESIPQAAPSGSKRYTTRAAFYRERLLLVALDYLVLDACSVLMMQDPYFINGPVTDAHILPRHLAALPYPLLHTYRALLSFAGVLAVLHAIFALDQLVRLALLAPLGAFIRGPRADLWHYPTGFGSLSQVLDRGLPGFWGRWWHQTFRHAFTAPSIFLSLPPVPAALVAFAHSGLLHAAGSITSAGWDATRPRGPLSFFLLSFVGVCAQELLRRALRYAGLIPRSRWMCRMGNLLFVAGWLVATQGLFVDDLARGGIWLLEPVPASPLRALGYGQPGDAWLRWGADVVPRWHWGQRWWECGIAL